MIFGFSFKTRGVFSLSGDECSSFLSYRELDFFVAGDYWGLGLSERQHEIGGGGRGLHHLEIGGQQ